MGRRAAWLVPLLLVLAAACTRDGGAPAGHQSATATPPVAGEQVRFETAAGMAVTGRLFGRGPGNGVVLAGSPGGAALDWLARDLAGVGTLVLVVDLPLPGVPANGGTSPAVAATRAATGYLRSRGADKVVLIGEREGATVVLGAAAGDKINGVAALSAVSEYRTVDAVVDSAAALPRIDRPVLLMAALGDGDAAVIARRLYEGARDPRTLALVPGQARGAELVRGADGAQALNVLRDFLREAFSPLSA